MTEEVWSWGFAESEGAPSIHRAPWPSAQELEGLAGEDGGATFDAACAFLDAVRKAKSGAGRHGGTAPGRAEDRGEPAPPRGSIEPCLDDLRAAARAEGDVLEVREGLEDGAFEVVEIELAEPRPRS